MSTALRTSSDKKPVTLAVLGSGTLGTSILSGIFASLCEPGKSGASEDIPQNQIPSRFIACVRSPESAKRIHQTLGAYELPLEILQNENIRGVKEADIIILGCKPYMIKDILDVPEMREALKGKLLISILAGVTAEQIDQTVYSDPNIPSSERCRVVRAMPNTSAIVRESMTVISPTNPPLPQELDSLVNWIFSRVGRVVTLPSNTMDASTALAGSSPAFCAMMLEAMADGGVAMGLPRAESQLIAAQVMRGTSQRVLNGEHPALLREKVCTPGGCTIGGLLVLDEGNVRGTISRAVREATVVASQLGQGVKLVNGTRH